MSMIQQILVTRNITSSIGKELRSYCQDHGFKTHGRPNVTFDGSHCYLFYKNFSFDLSLSITINCFPKN